MEMDGYNEEVTSSSSSAQALDHMTIDDYRAQNHARMMTPDFFELTCQNSKDFGAGSMSREWTNEKHSLFLNSMEASFVRRLRNQEYDADHLKPSNQFKMLQSGSWKQTNFEFSRPKANTLVDGRRALLDNQWVRHFRYVDKQQEFALPNQHENGGGGGDSIYSGGQKKLSHQRDEDSASDSTEVSDQNFVDEGNEETHVINHFKGKRMKKATEGAQRRDQVVPLSQYATIGDFKESRAYPGKDNISLDDHQLERMHDSVCPL